MRFSQKQQSLRSAAQQEGVIVYSRYNPCNIFRQQRHQGTALTAHAAAWARDCCCCPPPPLCCLLVGSLAPAAAAAPARRRKAHRALDPYPPTQQQQHTGVIESMQTQLHVHSLTLSMASRRLRAVGRRESSPGPPSISRTRSTPQSSPAACTATSTVG